MQGFSDCVDPTWTVTVLTDRGLDARWLFPEIVTLGWHPMMRVTRLGKFRPEGGNRPRAFWQFVPRVGRTWQGRGLAFAHKPERRLACTLLACWAEGHKDGWYDLTEEWRDGWCEHGDPQFKSSDWPWRKTRISEPDRAGRMGLAIALATFWAVAVGGQRDHDDSPQETVPQPSATDVYKRGPESPSGERLVSVLLQGIAVILAVLTEGQLALPEKWHPEPWPGLESMIQEREHDQTSKC